MNLEMGLARVDVMHKKWADAEKRYDSILENHPGSVYAPDAIYWRGVSHYSATHDHTVLADVAKTLTEKHKNTVEALKSQPWLK